MPITKPQIMSPTSPKKLFYKNRRFSRRSKLNRSFRSLLAILALIALFVLLPRNPYTESPTTSPLTFETSKINRPYPPPIKQNPINPLENTVSQYNNESVPLNNTATDPRFDRMALAIFTTRKSVESRLPIIYQTWAWSIKNILVLGNDTIHQIESTGLKMLDYKSSLADIQNRTVSNGFDTHNGNYTVLSRDSLTRSVKDVEKDYEKTSESSKPNGKQDTQTYDEYARRRLLKRRQISSNNTLNELHSNENNSGSLSSDYNSDYHISAVQILFDKHPSADWYILANDNAYVFTESLSSSLYQLDPSVPYYLGIPKLISADECTTNIPKPGPLNNSESMTVRVIDSSGLIILSKSAVKEVIPVIKDCLNLFRDCSTGDITLGQCLNNLGITISTEALATLGPISNTVPSMTSVDYKQEDACDQPISYGNVDTSWMVKLKQLQDKVRSAAQKRVKTMTPLLNNGTVGVHALSNKPQEPSASKSITHLPPSTNVSSKAYMNLIDSPNYAPVTISDIVNEFMDPNLNLLMKDIARPTGVAYNTTRSVISLNECRDTCSMDKACCSWEYDIKTLLCSMFKGIPAPAEQYMAFSGVIPKRYTCTQSVLS